MNQVQQNWSRGQHFCVHCEQERLRERKKWLKCIFNQERFDLESVRNFVFGKEKL